jgi:hypothetical protein
VAQADERYFGIVYKNAKSQGRSSQKRSGATAARSLMARVVQAF